MPVKPLSKQYILFLLVTYGGVVVLITSLSILIQKGDDVYWINSHHSGFLDQFFLAVTNLGQGWIFVPLLIASLFIRFYYAIIGLVIWIFHGLACSFLKRIIFSSAMRPTEVLDHSNLYFIPGVDFHANFSFPSGHTATIFCAAVFMSLLIRSRLISVCLIVIALLVAYSRVYLLQHFLIDIAGGAFVGTSIAFVGWYIFSRIKVPAWMNHVLEIKLKNGPVQRT